MDDKTIEICSDAINVEEIMAKIRENIRCRQLAGELPLYTPINAEYPLSENPSCINKSTQRDLSYIASNWDIRNSGYHISSHRPYIGKILVKGRHLVHEEVRRYVDPSISLQSEFNSSLARALISTSHTCSELDRKISDLKADFDQKISQKEAEFNQKISKEKDEIIKRFNEIFQLQKGIIENLGVWQPRKPSADKEGFSPLDLDYLLFENRFRGSCEEIKQRQLKFLPYFDKSSLVLDIGCGRGEFLEILREHNIKSIGIDPDAHMVAHCRSNQLKVEQCDAITYLENLEDNCLEGIFIDQVIEHLDSVSIIHLLSLSFKKLKPGHYFIAETVNPLSFVSLVNFYIDLSHKKPVHPETLQFLVNAAGFRESKIEFFTPVPEEGRLQKMNIFSEYDQKFRENVEIYNHNIEILNTILFGAQDYAVIARK